MLRSKIKLLLNNPGILIRSIFYSIKYQPKHFVHLPIISVSKSLIKCSSTGKININHRLNCGVCTARVGEIGQMDYDRVIVRVGDNARLNIGSFTLYPGARIIVGPNAKVTLGNNSFISLNTKIIASEKVEIGNNCTISWGVQILDTDFHNVLVNGIKNKETQPVRIGNNVWIGSKASILKGVTIGDGAVIAAGSVVTKNVPSTCLVGGIPARVLKEKIDWSL